MLELTRPALLLAGALGALVPLALHFWVPRPAEPRPLPTARFLPEDSRLRPQFRRRPSDLPLLALRMAFVLLLGALAAGARWVPGGSGEVDVLVVDGGEGMGSAWAEARAVALERGEAIVRVVGRDGLAGEPERETTLTELLREGAAAAAGSGAERARLTVVTRLRATAWTPALEALRPRLWPGPIELVEVGEGLGAGPLPPVALHVDPGLAEWVQGALALLGYDEVRVVEGWEGAPWMEGTRRVEGTPAPPPPGALLLSDGTRAAGPWRGAPGTPEEGAAVPLLWEGGAPAAAVLRSREGAECRAILAAEATGGTVDFDPEAVRALDELVGACRAPAERATLEPGPRARERLTGGPTPGAQPAAVAVAELPDAPRGRSLDRILLGLLLLLALTEGVLAYGRPKRDAPGAAR